MKKHRMPNMNQRLRWIVGLLLWCVTNVIWSGEVVVNRVTYNASNQEVSDLIASVGSLSEDAYQPDIHLLLTGINATRATVSLVNASPATCRQALAFALDCWWAHDSDGNIALLTGNSPPQGPLLVRTCTSTLRRQPSIPPLVERLIAPWLSGDAGLSFLPEDASWAATLDKEGHRRLFELLRVCENLGARATTRVADVDLPDLRRLTSKDLAIHSWDTLVNELAQSMHASVALAPRLQLQAFPPTGMRIRQQALGQIISSLHEYGIRARWSHGVLCLSENGRPPARFNREHPAQRRQLALIPIGHLITSELEGNILATMIKNYVAPGSWDLPGTALELLDHNRALLVAGDLDTQHAVLEAVNAIDRLGMELGLQTLAAARTSD